MGTRTIGELLQAAQQRLDRLQPRDALEESRHGALIVDTRCQEARVETGVIPGSLHVPLSVLYWRVDPSSGYADTRLSDPSRRIILFCADGYSSSLAAESLRALGLARTSDVIGGFQAWAEAGLPVLREVPAA